MDQYIRDFDAREIKSLSTGNIKECCYQIKICQNSFSIFHCNIRSANKNFDETMLLLNDFSENDIKFDVIVFSETWKIQDLSFFKIDGYTSFYNEGDYNQNDGVVVYIRDIHKVSSNHEIIALGDIKLLNVSLQINKQKIFVTALYRPHATCHLVFNENLKYFLDKETKQKENLYFLVGDTNIDIKSNKEASQEYLNILSEAGFVSLINSYTRIKNGSQSCIDHIFMKKGNGNPDCKSFVLEVDITDHFPIISSIDTGEVVLKQTKIKRIKKINAEKLKHIMERENWESIYQAGNVETATNELIYKIQIATEMATKEIKSKNEASKRQPWITSALVKSSQTKQKLFREYQLDLGNHEKEQEYKKYKNKFNKLLLLTKTNYFRNELENNKKNNKMIWNTINKFTNKKKERREIKQINFHQKTLTNDKEIANCFNKYFSSIGRELSSKILKPVIPLTKMKTINASIYLHDTDETEVENMIDDIKPNKAPGLDRITSNTLRSISRYVKKPIAYIINRIFETGQFPTCLKKGLVRPLFKKGDQNTMSNYRPISLISNISKIVEKIMKKRIIAFLDKYNFFSDKQFGFKHGISTENAIVYLTNNIYSRLDQDKPVLCVFLDLAKAFDTVDHAILINLLEDLGFRGVALKLLTTYLKNRSQFVEINDVISDVASIEYGVPQGTVLGPVLFSIYINGLLSLESSGIISSFADDTVILYEAENWMTIKDTVERDLRKIKEWFDHMSLTINFEKTKYIPFSCNSTKRPGFNRLHIETQNNVIMIEEANHIKYLGIEIDRNLKWDIHLKSLVKKLRSILFKFKQLRTILDIPAMKMIYFSLVESHIQYGIVAWGGTYKNHLKQLEVIQKLFIKIIYRRERTYCSDLLYKESDLLDIRQLYLTKSLLFQHKKRNELQRIQHRYETRHKLTNITQTIKTKKSHTQRSFMYIAPRIYRMLPNEIKTSNVDKHFKKELIKWLKSTPRGVLHRLVENIQT